jgi:hypothetical protein
LRVLLFNIRLSGALLLISNLFLSIFNSQLSFFDISGDHQSIVVGINTFIQVGLIAADRTTYVRCAKGLADYFNFFCEFRGLDYGKCARYSILE